MKVLALFSAFSTAGLAFTGFLRPADVRPGNYYLLRAFDNEGMALADCSGTTCLIPMVDNPNVLLGSKFTFPQGIPGPVSIRREGKVLGTTSNRQDEGVLTSVDVSTSGRFDNAIAYSTHGKNAISILVGFDQQPCTPCHGYLSPWAHIDGRPSITPDSEDVSTFWNLYETSQEENEDPAAPGVGNGPTTHVADPTISTQPSVSTQAIKRAVSPEIHSKRRL